jgi:SAM-dependent methyltransferase
MAMRAMPPEHIRRRSQGSNPDAQVFLNIGKRCRDDLEQGLISSGKQWNDFRSVLDFGCGCGRVLVWMADIPASWRLHGTDVDAEAINWCRDNLPVASWDVNEGLPPLPYADDSFDLVYAIAVFTHLDEERQLEWLGELKRVSRTGAFVLSTIFGQHCAAALTPPRLEELHRRGMCYMTRPEWKGVYPDWFGLAYHTEEYARSTYSRFFEVKEYLPRGLNNHLDLIVCENR